jgi:hypothetical protein
LQYVGMKLGKKNYWDLNWCWSRLIRWGDKGKDERSSRPAKELCK